MKSAIGNTFIVNFIIIFTIIFIGFFVGATSYTKAMRIKNRITDIIEENNGYNSNVANEIESYLQDAGYRIDTVDSRDCSTNSNSYDEIVYPSTTPTGNYDYCIFKYNTNKGSYYGVKTYMYLDLPLIGDKLKIGVYGETKVLGILGG